MNRTLSTLAIGLAALGIATAAQAFHDGPDIRIGPNFLEMSNNNTNYGFDSGIDKTYNIKPDFHLGYDIGASWQTGKGSDLDVEYRNWSNHDSDLQDGSGLSLNGAGSFDRISGLNYGKFDSLDVTAGHKFKVARNFDVDFFGGLNYTQFKQDFTLKGWTGSTLSREEKVGDSWYGYGPTLGARGTCHPLDSQPGLSVFGEMQGRSLYGMRERYRVIDTGTVSADNYPDEKVVIPGLRTKLGIDYAWKINHSDFHVNGGYTSDIFFGTNQGLNTSSQQLGNTSLEGFFLDLVMTY